MELFRCENMGFRQSCLLWKSLYFVDDLTFCEEFFGLCLFSFVSSCSFSEPQCPQPLLVIIAAMLIFLNSRALKFWVIFDFAGIFKPSALSEDGGGKP